MSGEEESERLSVYQQLRAAHPELPEREVWRRAKAVERTGRAASSFDTNDRARVWRGLAAWSFIAGLAAYAALYYFHDSLDWNLTALTLLAVGFVCYVTMIVGLIGLVRISDSVVELTIVVVALVAALGGGLLVVVVVALVYAVASSIPWPGG